MRADRRVAISVPLNVEPAKEDHSSGNLLAECHRQLTSISAAVRLGGYLKREPATILVTVDPKVLVRLAQQCPKS